ncbi:VPA1269 family protein [Pseudoalteromonas sp. SWN166]|uniref:VPA1269 family protein n=1 Tax=Pseudoalteromonas sp. SWN166 TaxID=2792061 RepID=UPI0018CF203B|nr:VPA1269 family protein [Pseudoalteromonas sp. SWN166]MBH0037763.1 tyrosine-type recombinase/integrase [Pseudoalteromonas sp. SWN166]
MDLFNEWEEIVNSNPLESVKFTTDLSFLVCDKGYSSGNTVLYNNSHNTVVINIDKVTHVGGVVNLLNEFSELILKQRLESVAVDGCITRDAYNNFPSVNTYNELVKAGFNIDAALSEQINFIYNLEFEVISSKNKIKKGLTTHQLSILWISWEKTFEGYSDIEIIKWLVYATRRTFPTLPSDTRKPLKGYKSVAGILKSPIGKLTSILKVKESVEIAYSCIEPIEDTLDDYLRAFKRKCSRVPISDVFRILKASLGSLLLFLANRNYLFLPYLFSYSTNNIVTKYMSTDSDSLISIYLNYIGQLDIKDMTGHRLSLRGVVSCSNIIKIQDIPKDFILDISGSYRDFYRAKGYSTGGVSLGAWRNLFEYIENEDWLRDHGRFNRTDFNKTSNRMLRTQHTLLESAQFYFMKLYTDESVVENLKEFSRGKSKSVITSLNKFGAWIVEESINLPIGNLREIKNNFIYSNGEKKTSLRRTLFEYLDQDEGSSSLYTKQNDWSNIKAFFVWWSKKESIELGENVASPVIENKPFGSPSKNSVTTRESMPSILHSFCVEVLSRNNYELYRDGLNRKQLRLYNFETKSVDSDVFDATIPRCLHMLLSLPVRGMQARWLDEGLLDDYIWDYDLQKYVKNSHPLSQFIYPNGKTHTQNFGRTGVLRSKSSEGNEDLNIFINTNKTQSRLELLSGGKNIGYEIPWPTNTDNETLNVVWRLLDEQKKFNNKYSPAIVMPCNQRDESPFIYSGLKINIPYYTPLFRRRTESVSKLDALNRDQLLMPITSDSITKLFHKVLTKAEDLYKDKYPQFKDSYIAFSDDGLSRYDLHSLRVYGITDLLDNGVPLEVVQMIVGHASHIMTLYYYKKSREEFMKILRDAKQSTGISIANERELLKNGGSNDEDLIALFDVVDEWNVEGIYKARPNFKDGGRDQVINGGICSSFNCADGGIDVSYVKGGVKVELSRVVGGDFNCGNCRYFRTGPRFLAEQIYYFNIIGMEIKKLLDEREQLIEKANTYYDNPSLQDGHIIAERYERQADKLTKTLAFKVTESRRRKKLIDESVSLASKNKNLPLNLNSDAQPDGVNIEEMSLFDACMEVTTQAVVLGLEDSNLELSSQYLEKFLSTVASLSKQSNPLHLIPDENIKKIAILYKLYDVCEMMGRKITDEEFSSPELLLQNLGTEKFNALGTSLTSIEESLIEVN